MVYTYVIFGNLYLTASLYGDIIHLYVLMILICSLQNIMLFVKRHYFLKNILLSLLLISWKSHLLPAVYLLKCLFE